MRWRRLLPDGGKRVNCWPDAKRGAMAARKRRRDSRFGKPRSGGESDLLFGLHAAEAALRNPAREIRMVLATANAAQKVAPALAARGLTAETVSASRLSARLGGDTVHQGILVEAAALPEPDFAGILASVAGNAAAGPLVVLDQVTDPHNVGAVLRSAAAFGAAALVTTRRHSPPMDGVLAKAASGAIEHVPVVRVSNLARALQQLGDAGLTRIGLDSEAAQTLETAPVNGPVALVLGAEDKGLRRLTRESCDYLCRIATQGSLASLNVSNAAAIALHACLLARNKDTS